MTDFQGNTPAHLAARTGATDLLMLLLDCGCEYDDQNSLGRSPLHIACSENQLEAVEALLRHGASVNVTDKEGVTPLMIAAKIGSAPVVESLLDNGADVNPVDSSKWSAADYARFTNHNQLHQRLKSLMHEGGSSGLFPQGLLNISDEVSTEEEGAVGLTRDRDMDEDGGDSWSDNSDIASIKEKPKINLTKFLPSSDDSGDNLFSSTPEPGSVVGPPKPPRLHASVSSLASEPVKEDDEETASKEEEDLGADDSWKSSSEEDEPKRISKVKEEENTDSKREDTKEKDVEADDSWKSSSEEDEPKKKLLPMFIGKSNSPKFRRDELLDSQEPGQSESHAGNSKFLADLGLDNMEFHSSEEVSFEDEDSMLPIEGTPTKVTVSRRNSQLIGDSVGGDESPRGQVLQGGSNIPKISEDEVSSNDWDNQEPLQTSPSITKAKEDGNVSPQKTSPKKSPSKRSPMKAKMMRKSSSIFDSDTDDEAASPRRPPRKKSLTPTKKRFSPSSFENSPRSLDSKKEDEDSKLGQSLVSQDAEHVKIATNNGKEILDALERKRIEVIAQGKLSDSSTSGGSKVSLAAGGIASSRTNSPSTVVGTLGREGTMQELEEVWEANASISPKKYYSSASNHGSEDSPEHEKSEDNVKAKAKYGDETDGVPKDEEIIPSPIEDQGKKDRRKTSNQLEPENTSRDVSEDDLISEGVGVQLPGRDEAGHSQDPTGASPLKMGRMPTSSEVRAAESKGNVQSLKEKFSVSVEESVSSPRSRATVRTPRRMSKEEQMSPTSPNQANDCVSLPKKMEAPSSTPRREPPFTSTPQSRKGSRSGITRSSGLGSIVFSDEESTAHDPLATPRCMDDVDDMISVASTETEESAHINSGLKDSILTPLSSLPEANNVNQLQDLVRELRLKLEKEFGRRAALETRISHMQQVEKQCKKHIDEQEEEIQHQQQEVSNSTSTLLKKKDIMHLER